MQCDVPLIKYRRDDKGKPKPGEKGFTRTAAQAQAEYEKWKSRRKMDLGAFMQNGKRVPVKN